MASLDVEQEELHTGDDEFDYPQHKGKLEYVIEDLLPSHQVHLIGGPSGSGKTTLMFQMYKAFEKGDLFLGRSTKPVKFAYISGDRPARSVGETQGRLGVDFKVYSLVDRDQVGADLANEILPALTKFYGYKPDFVYVDGFTALVPGGEMNSYSHVAKWLGSLQRYCEKHTITILGACHTTKAKEGQKFLNPRQRIAGSVAWAGFSETVIIIEPPEEDEVGNQRRVMLLPRNHPGEILMMHFNEEGVLCLPESHANREEEAAFIMVDLLPNGGRFNHGDLWTEAKEKGVPRRSFDRWLATMIEQKLIRRIKKGVYEINGKDASLVTPKPTGNNSDSKA